MKNLIKSLTILGIVVATVSAAPLSVSAQDATFIPQASAVLVCQDPNTTDKKITKFDNNAPAGKKALLFTGESEGGGLAYGPEVRLGDVIENTPQLFWSIEGVQLGPWEVPTTFEGTCLTNEAEYTSTPALKTNPLPYLIGAGAVLLVLGAFLLGKKLAKK